MTARSPAPDDVATDHGAAPSGKDSPKRHGDKFAAAASPSPAASEGKPGTGDSPKRQGDPMEKTIRTGAKR